MKTGNRGQVLLVFLAALLGLLGIAALGIDIGYLYTVRHELQRSTDAGALAGASAFFTGDWDDLATRAVADARARDYASRDTVVVSTLNPASEVQVSFPSRDRVRVDATRTANLFFASIFLGPTKTVTAYSVAEASVVNRNVRGLKPWGIPYPWEDLDNDGFYDLGEPVHRDCPEGITDASLYFCQGTTVNVKIGVPSGSSQTSNDLPSTQQESGHFFCLDFDTSGAMGYRDSIRMESPFLVSAGESVPLEPGNMVGPTIQGVTDLIQGDPDSTWNSSTNLPDSPIFSSQGGSEAWMSSPRMVRIPIYDPEDALLNGKTEMVVATFAGFWIKGIDHHLGTITGRLVPMRAIGSGGPSVGPVSGPVLRSLRLVE